MDEKDYEFFWCSSCQKFIDKKHENIVRAAVGKGADSKDFNRINYSVRTIFICSPCKRRASK